MSEDIDQTRRVLQGKDLVLTRRSFENILKFTDLSTDDLKALPEKSVILEIGSGEKQEFANGVKKLCPDLTVISLDPTLGISPGRNDVALGMSGDTLYYRFKDKGDISRGEALTFQQLQKERERVARRTGNTVAGTALRLPVANNSVRLLIDSHAAGLYLSEEEFLKYLEEVKRVIVEDGEARLYPIGFVGMVNSFVNRNDEHKRIEAEASKAVGRVEGLEGKYYFIDDGIGVILAKKSKSPFQSEYLKGEEELEQASEFSGAAA